MLGKLEDFFLNKFAGKLLARAAVTLAGVLVGQAASLQISLDPAEVTLALTTAAHAAFEWFKARRMKNPNSPAVQTDASKL